MVPDTGACITRRYRGPDRRACRAQGLHARQSQPCAGALWRGRGRSEEHTSELPSLMRISYAVFCLKKKNNISLNILPPMNINNNLTMHNQKDEQLVQATK